MKNDAQTQVLLEHRANKTTLAPLISPKSQCNDLADSTGEFQTTWRYYTTQIFRWHAKVSKAWIGSHILNNKDAQRKMVAISTTQDDNGRTKVSQGSKRSLYSKSSQQRMNGQFPSEPTHYDTDVQRPPQNKESLTHAPCSSFRIAWKVMLNMNGQRSSTCTLVANSTAFRWDGYSSL